MHAANEALRTLRLDLAIVEPQIRLQIAVAKRLKIEKSTDRKYRFHNIGGKSVGPAPVRERHHCCEMPTGRMTANVNVFRIAVEFGDMSECPGNEGAHLPNNFTNRDVRAKRIVGDDCGNSCCDRT